MIMRSSTMNTELTSKIVVTITYVQGLCDSLELFCMHCYAILGFWFASRWHTIMVLFGFAHKRFYHSIDYFSNIRSLNLLHSLHALCTVSVDQGLGTVWHQVQHCEQVSLKTNQQWFTLARTVMTAGRLHYHQIPIVIGRGSVATLQCQTCDFSICTCVQVKSCENQDDGCPTCTDSGPGWETTSPPVCSLDPASVFLATYLEHQMDGFYLSNEKEYLDLLMFRPQADSSSLESLLLF